MLQELQKEIQGLHKVQGRLTKVETENSAYRSQLPELKDWIFAISFPYERLQAEHKTLQTKYRKEEVKRRSVEFATSITQSKIKVADMKIIWLETLSGLQQTVQDFRDDILIVEEDFQLLVTENEEVKRQGGVGGLVASQN